MNQPERLVAQLENACADDYVGVWQVNRWLEEKLRDEVTTEELAMVIDLLLRNERIAIGQFRDGVFEEWAGNRESKLSRLRSELRGLGRAPDIGEVACLVRL